MESSRNYPALDAGSKKRVLAKIVEAESFGALPPREVRRHKRFSLPRAGRRSSPSSTAS